MSVLRQMRELDPDCLFVDCYGACPYQPCFNERHEHGPRVDEEWIGHRKFFEEAEEYCRRENKVLATEIVTDIAASYMQFIHGLINVDFRVDGNAFPQLFRYTFPEVVTTDRGIRHEEGDFARRLKCALTAGVRIDAELYVCRADLDRSPKYAEIVKYYTSVLEKYRDFMLLGTYTVIDVSPLPYYVKRGEYRDRSGKHILRILYNASDSQTAACGEALAPDEMRFDIYDEEDYRLMVSERDESAAENIYPDKFFAAQEAGTLPPSAS